MRSLRKGLTTTQTTPFNRLVGLTIGIVHIPAVIMGTLLALLGCVTIVLIPAMLLLYIPGMWLYVGAWKIYLDRMRRDKARRIWKWTMIYNSILMLAAWGLFLFYFEGAESLFFLVAVPEQLVRSFLAAMAYRDLADGEVEKEIAAGNVHTAVSHGWEESYF